MTWTDRIILATGIVMAVAWALPWLRLIGVLLLAEGLYGAGG